MKKRSKILRSFRSAKRIARSFVRTARKYVRRWPFASLIAVLLVGAWGGAMIYSHITPPPVDPKAYSPLLQTIAKGESNGNYNAHFGNTNNTAVHFTSMSIAEVLQWQKEFVRQGSPSNAVGRYQIIEPTLSGLVNRLRINPNETFDEAMQDRLAIALLERRGSKKFVAKELTREQFAANIAKEWAALPAVVGANPEESYYAGDGLNQSHVSINEVFQALHLLETQAGQQQG